MNVKPFVGVGVNYTTFFKKRVSTGGDLKLDDSVGVAGHMGLDIPFAPTESFRIDASLNGTDIGEINISPWVYGAAFVKQL